MRLEQIPQEKTHRADVLAKIAATGGRALPKGIPLQLLLRPSTAPGLEVSPVTCLPCWMDPIADYLQDGTLPENPDQAHTLKRIAIRYCLIEGHLYRRGKSLPLLRCLHPDDAKWALDEVHSGDYGNQISGERLAYQVLRMGYYWSTIHQDAKTFVQTCEPC